MLSGSGDLLMKYKNFSRDILKSDFEEGWQKWPSDCNKGILKPQTQKSCEPSKMIDLVDPSEFKFEDGLKYANLK